MIKCYKDNFVFVNIFLPFRVSDQGGGIDRETTDKIFKYLYTTAPKVPYSLHVFCFRFYNIFRRNFTKARLTVCGTKK
jgi:hypothetical protein